MSENKKLPKFDSIDKLTEFFDENDLGDYLDSMPETEFDVNLQKRSYFVEVDIELLGKLSEISKLEHKSSEKIVNSWIREKISAYADRI